MRPTITRIALAYAILFVAMLAVLVLVPLAFSNAFGLPGGLDEMERKLILAAGIAAVFTLLFGLQALSNTVSTTAAQRRAATSSKRQRRH